MSSSLEANKKAVQEFYDLIINKKDFESARKYMGDRYKQHNPLVADGPEGLKAFIEFLKTNFPDARSEIKRVFAEGDYVILHVHSIRPPNMRGRAIIEIFRLENGKIDEHWDVIQEIPEESANPNGMF
jgi:predicted SnoaL-like aldol condensation-catalyzing enzyme